MSLPWEGSVEGYTKNQAIKLLNQYNYKQFEVSDLVNEGYIVYQRILDKYPSITEPKHLMALYKTALKNRFWELSHFIKTEYEYIVNKDNYDVDRIFEIPGELDTMFRTVLSTAPKEVKDFLNLVIDSTANDILGLHEKHKRSFFNNPLLCKILGYDSTKINIIEVVKEYFSNK